MDGSRAFTLVLDPEGHDFSALSPGLLARGHLVATRRDAFECLSYVARHRPWLVLIRPTRLPGEAERIGDTARKICHETRVVVLPREEGEAFRRSVERAIDSAMRDRAAGA